MTPRIKSALSHGAMAFLYALGMALTLLGVTGLLRHGWLCAWTLAALTGAVTGLSLNRKAALCAGGVGLFAGAVWLLAGGAGMIAEVVRALMLHMSGLMTALPMVGTEFAMIVCVLSLAVSWFVTQRSAGAFPALILLVLTAVLLWLGDWPDVLICLLPSVLACVTMLLRAGDEHTSTVRVLPLAAAVTAIAFIGVWMGGADFAPMKKLADSIRQRIYDTFFYTQPRDVFTLATEGYYPQGAGQLGGPAEPHEEPVMAVITPRKTYLRGVVKNIYTGRSWQDDIGGRRYLLSATRFEELRRSTFDMDLPLLDGSAQADLLASRTLQVRMLRDSASTLFVPQRLRSLTAEGDLLPYFNASSEVFVTSNLQLGDLWTAEAALFTADDAGMAALVNAADTAADPGWDAACATYMQLPDNTIDPRVYELCAQITNGIYRPFDRAMAIQRYLQAHYAYTLDVPEQSPNHDFVSTFLIETEAGYCTHFATAMTVLCRMAGLPARYAEGYVAYPDAEGLAVVTGQEGHAWTEVYFRGFGWVTFDATPISTEYTALPPETPPAGDDQQDDAQAPDNTPEPSEEPSQPPEDAPTPTPSPDPDQAPQPSPQPSDQPVPDEQDTPQPEQDKDIHWSAAVIWLLLVLLAIRAVLVQPAIQAMRANTAFRRWLVWVQAAHDALRRHDLRREPSETPSAFLMRVERTGKLAFSLAPMAQAENLMFYGHADPYEEEIAQAKAGFTALYRTLTPWQKLIFQGERILLPRKFGKRDLL